ncbi:hypothetical protein CXB51_034009 [Gossypium anomalum]|uniref:DUF7745 domain-containing protein n=1 Tax=Gossypium anomalum TaxID=47600 RepID=A0A8J5Y949_9ROSI|nr:hypothetical protein CXB51_034009 [Gossypium anomalum]
MFIFGDTRCGAPTYRDSGSLSEYVCTYVFVRFSSPCSHRETFFDKVEDNAAVRIWAETTQQEKGDSLTEGYVSELLGFTRVSVTQNNLQEMKEIWAQWDDEIKRLCFTFGKVDLVPTIEEYTALIRCPKIQVDRIYSKAANGPPFSKRLMNITGMSKQWKRVDVFSLSIYGLVIFPKALGHVDEAVSDLFDRLSKGTTPVPAILAETFSHFWKVEKASYRVFSENYSPLKELAATPRRDDITEENWMAILQNLQEEDVEWRASWMVPDEILYRCGDFDWVPLLRVWGAVGYAPLLVLRQYRSR